MSSYLYIEGGARGLRSGRLRQDCQRAFRNLLERMGLPGPRPRLVACGSRNDVFDRFCIQLKSGEHDYVAMWIDSEDPLSDVERTWDHLSARDLWERPFGAVDEQVLFMTTCMETWIMADSQTLKRHYGTNLQETALLPLKDLEKRPRGEVQKVLIRATRNCSNAYAKGCRSYAVFGSLDPLALESLPSFARIKRILQQRLR